MASRAWWVQALNLTRYLCHYLQKHKNKMPADLSYQTTAFFTAIQIYCDALEYYDLNHARGKGV